MRVLVDNFFKVGLCDYSLKAMHRVTQHGADVSNEASSDACVFVLRAKAADVVSQNRNDWCLAWGSLVSDGQRMAEWKG